MQEVWNKNNTIQYEVRINNICIIINSHIRELHFAVYPGKTDLNHKIIIWYEKEIPYECKNIFFQALAKGKKYFPKSILDAYDYLGLGESDINKHINKYVQWNNGVFVHYSFPSDDFYVAYYKNSNEMYVWGNEANLERILISFLSMTGDTLPYHAACVRYHNKGFMIIGDTYSGKTSLVLSLLARGASYIADDILYVDENNCGHRCCEYLSIRNNYIQPNLKEAVEFSKAEKSFINISKMCLINHWEMMDEVHLDKIILINPLKEANITCTKLFCTFRHDSMFSLELLNDKNKYIGQMVVNSMKQWHLMTGYIDVEEIVIDYSAFEKSIDAICEAIFN